MSLFKYKLEVVIFLNIFQTFACSYLMLLKNLFKVWFIYFHFPWCYLSYVKFVLILLYTNDSDKWFQQFNQINWHTLIWSDQSGFTYPRSGQLNQVSNQLHMLPIYFHSYEYFIVFMFYLFYVCVYDFYGVIYNPFD